MTMTTMTETMNCLRDCADEWREHADRNREIRDDPETNRSKTMQAAADAAARQECADELDRILDEHTAQPIDATVEASMVWDLGDSREILLAIAATGSPAGALNDVRMIDRAASDALADEYDVTPVTGDCA